MCGIAGFFDGNADFTTNRDAAKYFASWTG